ncbi:MAG: nucleotidyltransferase family protein [Pseudomonadota bacterium]
MSKQSLPPVAVPPVMILAAGLGTRMRPITDHLPKPLVKVGGETMLDRVLDTFADEGATKVVINTHYLPHIIEAHCAERTGLPTIAFSPEVEERLETGGGIKKALPLLGETVLTTNADSFWVGAEGAVTGLIKAFDPERMDMLLLLVRDTKSVGFDQHPGDFARDDNGRLSRRGDAPWVPWHYTGTAIMRASLFEDTPEGAFSLNVLFDRAIANGRLYGHELDGLWFTVGTPEAITEAEEVLANSGHL